MRRHGHSPDPNESPVFPAELARLEMLARQRGRALGVVGGALFALAVAVAFGAVDARHQLLSCRAKLVESRHAPSALARVERDASAAPAAVSHPESGGTRFTIAM